MRPLGYFWNRNPALFFGLHLYLGISLALQGVWVALFALLPLWCVGRLRFILLGCALLLVSYFYALPSGTIGEHQSGRLVIEDISVGSGMFSKGWAVKGRFGPDRLPVRVQMPRGSGRPKADREYAVEGTLKVSDRGNYTLKVAQFEEGKQRATLAEWRFRSKQRVNAYLRSALPERRNASFLSGLVTGTFNDSTLLFSFGRLGLQHLMAVSGFHFSILAFLLASAVCPWLPRVRGTILLALLLTAYFLFVGMGPSVQRAWVMALVALVAGLVGRTNRSLNALGLALIITLVSDPWAVRSLGFQFSFLCTGSILIWYRPMRRWLTAVIPAYKKRFLLALSDRDQYAYIALGWFRLALALTVAVNIAAIPLTLYHFHRFPLMSLVYNLFFPAMVTLLAISLCLAALIDLVIPPLGTVAFWLLDQMTTFTLNFAYDLPPLFDFKLRLATFPAEFIAIMLIALTSYGIVVDPRNRKMYINDYEPSRAALL